MPAGRKLGFDPDEVIASAMRVFWERGYTATTKTDIEAATGIARSSLANTFGSKEDLFYTCVDAFLDLLLAGVQSRLVDRGGGLSDVEVYFEAVAAETLGRDGPRGCLIVKTMMASTECPPTEAQMGRYRSGMIAGFVAALERSARLGEIAEGTIPGRAELLFMWFNALHMTADSALASTVDQQLAAVRTALREWAA